MDRLGDIVEGLLALSRLDAGEGQSERVTFDLAELAATTVDQMGLLAEDKNITVACEFTSAVPVEGDRARLKQVVVNLLDNAIKYTPRGGSVRLQITRENGYAVLDVTDDGIGIPPEALPHVFKRFFRVDDSRSRDHGGAGLGLSIVKSICTAHGAQLEVASLPGQGSSIVELSQAQLELTSAQIANAGARYDLLFREADLGYQIGTFRGPPAAAGQPP